MKTPWKATRFGLRCAAVLVLAFGTVGCLVIPTPHADTGFARTNLTKLTPQQFTVGQSTLEDVVLALGEPDAVSADEHRLAYRSEKNVAIWIIAAAGEYGGGATGGGINRERFYRFDFDSQGRLRAITQRGKLLGNVGFAEVEVSHPLFEDGNSNAVPSGLAGEQIRAVYPYASWLPGVDGYQSKGALYEVGSPGRLVLTESNLNFFVDSQFANTGPALRLPLASVTGVRVNRFLLARRLVVSAGPEGIHSFEIYNQPGRFTRNAEAMRGACQIVGAKTQGTADEPRRIAPP